jgi:tryptophan-rich sensory protein
MGKLLKSIAIPLAGGLLASLLTRQSMGVFDAVSKPPLSPPAILFPIVWTVLYTVMGIGYYLVITSESSADDIAKAARVYGLQLAVNFLWPTFFFNFQWYLFSFLWLILLWILVLVMIYRFWKISKPAALINVPYLIWLTFAAYLNLGIYILNG